MSHVKDFDKYEVGTIRDIMPETYPIAEIFTSWQGEGLWSGTRMTFVRLAGCNVGKMYPPERYPEPGERLIPALSTTENDLLPIYARQCTTWDGRRFQCDTDYQMKERLTAKEIIDRVPEGVQHMCLTGGEPLQFAVKRIFDAWMVRTDSALRKSFHIETSGTREYSFLLPFDDVWVTVSPKAGCLDSLLIRADEVKLLVDEDFNTELAEQYIEKVRADSIIWLSPINGEHSLNDENKKRCLEILEQHPTWRMANQNQKLWGVR